MAKRMKEIKHEKREIKLDWAWVQKMEAVGERQVCFPKLCLVRAHYWAFVMEACCQAREEMLEDGCLLASCRGGIFANRILDGLNVSVAIGRCGR